jgi:hypothetical protein
MHQLQQHILDRMTKIVPSDSRINELLKYDEYWHRFDGKVNELYDKTFCGEVFKAREDTYDDKNYYRCALLEEFKTLPICPKCLEIWYKKEEKKFEEKQLLGTFELSLWDENAEFIQSFIENEGYDKLNRKVNELLLEYLQENNLLKKLKKQTKPH